MNSDPLIVAYTPANGDVYPPYLNIQYIDESTVRVTVRSDAKRNQSNEQYVGETSYIDIPLELFEDIADSIYLGVFGE